jgi:hypothetical protein
VPPGRRAAVLRAPLGPRNWRTLRRAAGLGPWAAWEAAQSRHRPTWHATRASYRHPLGGLRANGARAAQTWCRAGPPAKSRAPKELLAKRHVGRDAVADLSGAIPFWGRVDSAASCDDAPARAGRSGKRVRLREAARELRPPPHAHGAARSRRSPRSASPGVAGSPRREAPRERRGARARPGSTDSSTAEASPRLMASERPRAPRAKRSEPDGPEGAAGPRKRWGFGIASRWDLQSEERERAGAYLNLLRTAAVFNWCGGWLVLGASQELNARE